MNENNLFSLKFQGHSIRTVLINSVPWYVAQDIADILSLEDISAMVGRLHYHDVDTIIAEDEKLNIVSLNGIMEIMAQQEISEDDQFRKWVRYILTPAVAAFGKLTGVK